LTEGGHGFHIHESGSCEDMGKAAGGHYNPAHASHGEALKSGVDKAHAGDMGNIVADAKGQATLSIVLPGVTVSNSKTAVAGRSVVIHEKIDDFSQPTGNAGGRIACGIIGIMTPQAPATPAPTKNK
jgi:Cu-Zn family superoxide dismutase